MHVVVTGGSSGIGLEVASLYLRRGASVSIIARNSERLEAARSDLQTVSAGLGRVFTASADVSASSDLRAAIAACEAAHGPCEVLVACAGTVEPGRFHEQSEVAFDAQLATNLAGTINAVRHVYSGMRQRGRGRIMIVSSATAFIGIPGYAAYCASKSALVGFADALRLEALAAGIFVGICFPPDTDTPQLAQELATRPEEADVLIGSIRPRKADEIARVIVDSIDRKTARTYFSLSIAALAMFGPSIKPFLRLWIELWLRLRAWRRA